MPAASPDTDELLRRASAGNAAAHEALLIRHRTRLRQMVSHRLDPRIGGRVDPSDVVQEVLFEAAGKLSDYLRRRPLPFYPWLRQIAWDRIVDLHRRHVKARKRSVRREEPAPLPLPDESAAVLADRLISSASSPSERAMQSELRRRLRHALDALSDNDREVLVLRHLEQLSVKEIAAVLGISEGAVKVRHVRALERLRTYLKANGQEHS